jgi:hypothetical protein
VAKQGKLRNVKLKDLPPIMRRLIQFKPQPGVKYLHAYEKFFDDPARLKGAEEYLKYRGEVTYENNQYLLAIRNLQKTDIFFNVNFVAGNPIANDPKGFVTKMCALTDYDLQRFYKGEQNNFLTVMARGHFKTSARTEAMTLQHILNYQDDAILILSATKELARGFLRSIRLMCQMPEMIGAFSDVLYKDYKNDSPNWTKDALALKRTTARKEYSIETAGLMEGMPVSRHYNIITSDDIETQDLVDNPAIINKLKTRYQMSKYLCTNKTMYNVIGTYYHHKGLLVELRDAKKRNGVPIYDFKKVPCVAPRIVKGKAIYNEDGEPVFLTREQIEEKMAEGLAEFYTQYMCDPAPRRFADFTSDQMKLVPLDQIPKDLFKIVLVDPSGSKNNADPWAILTIGMHRNSKNVHDCNIYITNLVLQEMQTSEAIDTIINAYTGGVRAICIEQMNLDVLSYTVKKEIEAKKNIRLIKDYNLIALHPQGAYRGSKHDRIRTHLTKAFNDGRIHISSAISREFRNRFIAEIDQFPLGEDNTLDALAYIYKALEKLNYEYTTDVVEDNVIYINSYQENVNIAACASPWGY